MARFGQGGKKKKSSGAPPQPVDKGVGHSRAPFSFVYQWSGSNGTMESVRVKIRPGEFEAWRNSRFVFVMDPATGEREQELTTFEAFEDACNTLEASGKYLWVEHPYDNLAGRVVNIERGVTNQANAFEMKSTRAIVNDSELHAELETSKLTPVNDGRSVTFCRVTKKGNLRELFELDGLAMNRENALLVVNEAKLSPSEKDIGATERKELELDSWLQKAAGQPDTFVTKPADVKDELAGIQWKIRLVLSGDNFTAQMEEECNKAEILVVRSNGAGYGLSRPSSASSTSTEPAPDVPPSSPSASPSSPPLPLGEQSAV